MHVRVSDVLEFLRGKKFFRVLDYPVLDVGFTETSWTNGQVEVDMHEQFHTADLEFLGEDWTAQQGGGELFREFKEWASLRGVLLTYEQPPGTGE